MFISTLPYKVMGFAMAVRDLERCGAGIDRDELVRALIEYANEYEAEKLAESKKSTKE